MVDILARLKIRAEEFSRGSKAAFGEFEREAASAGERASAGFGQRFSVGLAGLMTGAAATAAFTIGKQALDQAKDLKQQSQQLGVSTDALQEYRYAAEQVGVTQADLSGSMGDLLMKIADARSGSKDAGEAFKDLGIDVTTASGSAKNTSDVMAELIARLNGIADPIERARAKSAIFGDSWRQIDPLLSAGAARVNSLREAAHQFGVVISEDAIQNADVTAQKLSQVRQVLEAKMATVVLENTDAIMGLANALGWAADKASWFFKTMQGVERIKRDEGWAAGFFASPARQEVAADPVRYLQSRTTDLQKANGEVERLVARRDNSRAGQQARNQAVERQQEALRLMQVARQEVAWMRVKPQFTATPTAKPPVETPAKSSGGGSSRSASSGKSDADREREKQNDAEQRLRESLEETIERQRDSQQLADLRASGLDRQADLQEALLDLQRRFPGIQLEDNKAAADALGIREDMVPVMRELYEMAKAGEIASVNREHDAAEAKARVENERKAQEEIDRLREEADERQRRSVEDLSRLYYDLFSGHSSDIWRDFKREGMEVMATLAAQWTIAQFSGRPFDPLTALNTATSTMGFGGPASAILSALTNGGGRASGLAEQAAAEGGDAGQIAAAAGLAKQFGATSGLSGIAAGAASVLGPLAMASAANSMIGEIFGFKGGPLGVLTGPISNLINPSRSAGATITGLDSVSIGGKDKKQYGVASGLADSVLSGLKDLADQLGGSVGSFRTTIGIRDGDYRVNPTGSSLKTKNGAVEFDDDVEGAIAYAIADAVSDGAIMGISEASKRLLTSGADLSEAIQKAAAIEAIPKALQARLDPVGYAIEQLNDKWDDTWAALKEGAATAEQMAEAQQLYNLELEEVKSSTASAAQSLKDYLKAMDAGSSSPLSLRDQEKAAYDELSVYLDKIGKGQSIDQSAYLDAAQTWLDIERQLYGSTSKYFEAFDAIQAATSSAISSIENVSSIAAASDQLAQETASAAKTTATTTTSMAADTSNMVLLLERQLAASQALLKALGASDGSTFTGTSRNY